MIRAPKTPGCFLCVKHAESNDKENLVLERGEHCYCLMNLYPYTNGHLLIAPYQHTGDIGKLSPVEMSEMMRLAQRWTKVLSQCAHPEGYNIGMNIGQVSGAGVAEHLHMHIVPRWNGDTNYMTVFGGTRLINQALEETWEELIQARKLLSQD